MIPVTGSRAYSTPRFLAIGGGRRFLLIRAQRVVVRSQVYGRGSSGVRRVDPFSSAGVYVRPFRPQSVLTRDYITRHSAYLRTIDTDNRAPNQNAVLSRL